MIRYSLACSKDHQFESWFASAQAFDSLRSGGHLSCAVCGDIAVTKALMAPSVRTEDAVPLSRPANPAETALAELRRKIEAESDYVGMSFAAEARAMHDGEIDSRPIYGEAKPEEARALIEDGIPVAPLPFVPRSRTN